MPKRKRNWNIAGELTEGESSLVSYSDTDSDEPGHPAQREYFDENGEPVRDWNQFDPLDRAMQAAEYDRLHRIETMSNASDEPMEQAAARVADVAAVGRGQGGVKRKNEGADLLASSHRRFLQGTLQKFCQRYCIVMYSFGQMAKMIDTGTAYIASPLYVFNPAHLGQYLTPSQLTWLNGLDTGGFNTFVRKIKGSLKFAGINAPFVTETTTQNATNSQLTAVGMRGTGLERIAPVYQGTATINETSATLTDWTIHGANAGFDWQSNQNSSGTFSTTAWAAASKNADRNFIEYTTTGCVKSNASTTVLSNIAQIGRSMQVVDLTSSQGEMLAWDHDMDCCAIGVNAFNGNLGLVDNAKASVSPDTQIALTSSTGTNALSLNPADSSVGDATANMYLSHHNVYKIGASETRHQELPPKEYLQLVPAPTINPAITQDFYIMGVLDVEMTIELQRDNMFVSSGTRADKTMYVKKSKFLGDSQVHMHGNCASTV